MKHTLPVREMRHKLAKFKRGEIFLQYKIGALGFKDIVLISLNNNRGTVGFLGTMYDILNYSSIYLFLPLIPL